MAMTYVVIGTAGHIDHGKSSLIKELTGTDPDRLPEEKERQITIDIGFAHMRFDRVTVGFVDVPGHERFVRNMLAGVGGVDGFLMVVSAAEGIREQTREHAEILRLLGITSGVVAVTKIDLPDARPGIVEECREYFSHLFPTELPVLRTSVRTGEGVERLREEVQRLAERIPERAASGAFRLAIDRVFTMRGAGTVVTGTAVGGRLALGDEVEVLPSGVRAKVRQMQVYGEAVTEARAGQRLALNLHGVDREDLGRGEVVVRPAGALAATTRILAAIEEASLAPRPLRHAERVRVCAGTAEALGRCYLFTGKEVEPGASPVFAEIRLEEPLLVLQGDPFILRAFSPVVTHGGGRVVENHPLLERRRYAEKDLRDLSAGRLEPLLRQREHRGLSRSDIVRRTGREPDETALRALGPDIHVHRQGAAPLLIWREALEALQKRILAEVDAFHSSNPLKPGTSLQDLSARLALPEAELAPALDLLLAAGTLLLASGLVARSTFRVQLGGEKAALRDRIEGVARAAGKKPVELAEIVRACAQPSQAVLPIITLLLSEKRLLKVATDLYLHADSLRDLTAALAGFKRKKPRISVLEFKDLTGTTRKHAIPLLEFLDRQRLTRREKDERIILVD